MSHIGLIASDEQVHAHSGAAASREMWQAVLHRAFLDATYDGDARADKMEQITCDRWIRQCGKDFRQVCALAGMDADFLSDAYKSGRVDRHLLKGTEDTRRVSGTPERGQLPGLIVKALNGEMTTVQVKERLGEMGYTVSKSQVVSCLTGTLTRRHKVGRRLMDGVSYWSLSREPHVSCKDRIAAAKAEASA